MKSITIILGVIFSVSFYFNIASAELLKEQTVEVGAEMSHISYKEPGTMKEDGIMYGVSSSYTYHNNLMLGVEGRFSLGEVDYKNSGTIENIEDYIWEARGLGGWDFFISPTFAITPYIGFGYRYLNDDMAGMTSSTGAKGYERESNYYYSPAGIEIVADLQNDWYIGGMVEYDYFWEGKQKSHLSSVYPGLGDVENGQNDGYGIRGSIKIQKKCGDIDFLIEPFIRYWNIQESDIAAITYYGEPITYGYEPKNNSTEIGFSFAIIF